MVLSDGDGVVVGNVTVVRIVIVVIMVVGVMRMVLILVCDSGDDCGI